MKGKKRQTIFASELKEGQCYMRGYSKEKYKTVASVSRGLKYIFVVNASGSVSIFEYSDKVFLKYEKL